MELEDVRGSFFNSKLTTGDVLSMFISTLNEKQGKRWIESEEKMQTELVFKINHKCLRAVDKFVVKVRK